MKLLKVVQDLEYEPIVQILWVGPDPNIANVRIRATTTTTNNNNNLICTAPACRMTSEALICIYRVKTLGDRNNDDGFSDEHDFNIVLQFNIAR